MTHLRFCDLVLFLERLFLCERWILASDVPGQRFVLLEYVADGPDMPHRIRTDPFAGVLD